MSVRQGMQRIGLGAALLLVATTASAGTAMALETTPREDQQLVEQCHRLAIEHNPDHDLKIKQIYDSNLPDYEQGEEFELLVSLLGHGNTFHNVTCHVSPEGEVSYKGHDQGGLPSVGS